MATSYDVKIHSIEPYKGKHRTTYSVRWVVAGQRFRDTFDTRALADSFRSRLVTATRAGEAFDTSTGRPPSEAVTTADISWYEFACAYVDMKWAGQAATSRRGRAEALVAITPALLLPARGKPSDLAIRSTLTHWSFNTARRLSGDSPDADVATVVEWLSRNTAAVSALAEPGFLRVVLHAMSARLDGRPAAATVLGKRRQVLHNALEYAVELGHLAVNPLVGFKWKRPKASGQVDRRTVVNPVQARTLLLAVGQVMRAGPRLVAFFALMYFAALRPEEAVDVRAANLVLPDRGWGTVHVVGAAPHAGTRWTDDGAQRDHRQLKHRALGEGRPVPCPPELVELLRSHIERFGTGADGRLFVGEFAAELPKITYMRTWRAARRVALTEEAAGSPLGATPYSLRHACVSTWLNGGVPATQVAEWAGHSVEVLLKVYAKCLDGADEEARRRIETALGWAR